MQQDRHPSYPGLDYPIIPDSEALETLSTSQIRDFIAEAKDRFSQYFPEGRAATVPDSHESRRGHVLIARHVTVEQHDCLFDPESRSLQLESDGNLYVGKVPEYCHGCLHAQLIYMADVWMNNNGIRFSDSSPLDIAAAVKGAYGNTKAEPDVVISGITGSPVAIIEFEVTHRSAPESRRQAEKYFENESVKLVMLVKVYPRRLGDQCFAAVCVIWVQNNHGGPITCLEAHDFGTRAMHRSGLAHLQNDHPDGVRVDETIEYTMPQLHRLPLLDRIPQNATMPALPMLAHVTNEEERTILNSILTNLDDMKFDLSFLAKKIELHLPPV